MLPARSLHGPSNFALPRRLSLLVEEPQDWGAEHAGQGLRRRKSGTFLSARDELGGMALPEPSEPIQLAETEVWNERAEDREAVAEGVGDHDISKCHVALTIVNDFLQDPEAGGVDTTAIAARIRAHVAERKRTDPDYSMRRFSKDCGLNPSQLSVIVGNLEKRGVTPAMDIMVKIAAGAGRSVAWLVGEGEAVPAPASSSDVPCFGDLESWPHAVAAACSQYSLPAEGIRAVARWRADKLPTKPLDARLIVSLIRAWEDMQGR